MILDAFEREDKILAPEAAHARNSRGRRQPEREYPVRTCYQRDRDRIIHCKSFRRLKMKTQVFIAPDGDHYRTRLTHTLEVMQIARTIARALCLNEDLTEAIALGHDLGHTPFGHAGERALNEIYGSFRHNEQSLRVVDVLEKDGQGLNLTEEVRSGILNHSGNLANITLEGEVVQLADRIAYVNHDTDDALRAGLIRDRDLPQEAVAVLGSTNSKRINAMILSVLEASQDLRGIRMNRREYQAMDELRNFLFARVYRTPEAVAQEERLKLRLHRTFDYYTQHPELVPGYVDGADVRRAVCDYIAGMSDGYALKIFAELGMGL
ncbi:MAG: deoxyguanosinetriphosphate triphosphohydrolase [Firmicutes bacterium]|nr:deoxyguanosinetriphosphate triphosphohydrolase [Bacillota bacterium]